MRAYSSSQKYFVACLCVSVLASIGTIFFLLYEKKLLSAKVIELSESQAKLSFLLSLERPAPLTPKVREIILRLDDHMYSVRNKEKEKRFARCMMQAVTDMTGSLGLYIDLHTCGEYIVDKDTLALFNELEALEVAPECRNSSIRTQYEFNMCRQANEDYSAKLNAMNRLFKLVTSHTLWEMHLISKGEYGKR